MEAELCAADLMFHGRYMAERPMSLNIGGRQPSPEVRPLLGVLKQCQPEALEPHYLMITVDPHSSSTEEHSIESDSIRVVPRWLPSG